MNKPVKCPTCGRTTEWSRKQRWRPFCSARCRLIDLGEWLDGERRIPGTPDGADKRSAEH
ncbi:MAG: DNA gyrase inhibitor YacG [Gammaproteobacteria bacterium]|nr:DNA gyrase inhibitor YacG [Gammaproteobacteria bacterium]NIR84232.1 DNA gyrase inhibitor YacG [Gammaproteobacteria bacterium]NIR89702.1 DNA gyrase inhibitor YacG [Gammaproteobacteria bacterium]NIU05390.1 DNA gyrase inhibitor YacG [Gammaproteobacteria bacterium]NIV52336.1 DNA gyrase inhibitor YacG [Gammaproteobacteria bacterium]